MVMPNACFVAGVEVVGTVAEVVGKTDGLASVG